MIDGVKLCTNVCQNGTLLNVNTIFPVCRPSCDKANPYLRIDKLIY